MIQIQIISSDNNYILPKFNCYYIIDKVIDNGSIFISKELSSYTFIKNIGYIHDNNIVINSDICNELGISYIDKKFYFKHWSV